jgi:hypothetical protein
MTSNGKGQIKDDSADADETIQMVAMPGPATPTRAFSRLPAMRTSGSTTTFEGNCVVTHYRICTTLAKKQTLS